MAASCATAVANIYYNQPLLDDFARYFHTSIRSAGLIATAAQVGYGTGLLLFIPLGDVVERKKVIFYLSFACTALLAVAAMSPTFWILVIAQLLIGITAVNAQLLIPLAVEMSPTNQRGRTVGSLVAGLLTGLLLARTVSGFIGEIFGWRTMFWIAAGVMFLTGIVLQVMLPTRQPTQTLSYSKLMRSLWNLFRTQRTLRAVSTVGALSFAAFCAFWAVLSFFMQQHHHRGSAQTGLFGLIGLGGAMCAPFAGRFSDKKGPAFTLTLALILSVFSFALMWFDETILGLILGVLLLDLGVQSTQVAAQAEVMALLPEARNRLNTLYMAMRFGGGALGSTLGVLVYSRHGWSGTSITCIVLLVLATVVHLKFQTKKTLSAVPI
jgi:predicted MFS family arabinose efflux permease